MIPRTGATMLALAMLLPLPAMAQSNGQPKGGDANAPGALMTTCPTQQDGHKAETPATGSTTPAPAPANPTTRSTTGINGQTTCPDGTVPPTGTTSANGGAGA